MVWQSAPPPHLHVPFAGGVLGWPSSPIQASPAGQQMSSAPHAGPAGQPCVESHALATTELSAHPTHASTQRLLVHVIAPLAHVQVLQPSPAAKISPEEYVAPPRSHADVLAGLKSIRPHAMQSNPITTARTPRSYSSAALRVTAAA